MIECEFDDGIGDGEFGFENLVGFLLAVELFLVGGGSGPDGRGGGYEVRRGEGGFEVRLPARRLESAPFMVVFVSSHGQRILLDDGTLERMWRSKVG